MSEKWLYCGKYDVRAVMENGFVMLCIAEQLDLSGTFRPHQIALMPETSRALYRQLLLAISLAEEHERSVNPQPENTPSKCGISDPSVVTYAGRGLS